MLRSRIVSRLCELKIAAVLLACPLAVVGADEVKLEQAFEPRQFSHELPGGEVGTLNYRLLKPKDYDPAEQYPLVIFLHGAGERGDDNLAQLKHGMKDFLSAENREKRPCYVLAPQCPRNQKWADVDWTKPDVKFPPKPSSSMVLTLALVDAMLEKSAIDAKRVYITGLSMGGYGTWDALARRPDFFAAGLPICGGADPATAAQVAQTPVWCFHGAKDRVVPVRFSQEMVRSLKELKAEPKYTEYPEAGHDSWTETYGNADVYTWLFAQRREAKQVAVESK